jgi:hypothetical protein
MLFVINYLALATVEVGTNYATSTFSFNSITIVLLRLFQIHSFTFEIEFRKCFEKTNKICKLYVYLAEVAIGTLLDVIAI